MPDSAATNSIRGILGLGNHLQRRLQCVIYDLAPNFLGQIYERLIRRSRDSVCWRKPGIRIITLFCRSRQLYKLWSMTFDAFSECELTSLLNLLRINQDLLQICQCLNSTCLSLTIGSLWWCQMMQKCFIVLMPAPSRWRHQEVATDRAEAGCSRFSCPN